MTIRYWTRKRIAEVIHTCTNLTEFKNMYRGAYNAMERNGWNDLKMNMIGYHARTNQTTSTSKLKWTRDAIHKVVQQCTSVESFIKQYDQAYRVMKLHNWMDLLELIPHTRSKTINWTEAIILDIIQHCHSRNEFITQYNAAYQAMRRNNWYHLITNLPKAPRLECDRTQWSVYRWLFPESHSVYIGISTNYSKRIYTELRYEYASPIHNHLQATGDSYQITELHHGLSGTEAANLEIAYIEQYKLAGYNILNRNRGGSLGGYKRDIDRLQQTDQELLDTIYATYSTYHDFKVSGKNLYKECKQRHLLNKVYSKLPRTKYSKEYMVSLLSRYTTCTSFKTDYPVEYRYILHHNWQDILYDNGLSLITRNTATKPANLPEIVEKINNGELTQLAAIRQLGISQYLFRKYTQGMIHKAPVKPGKRIRPQRSTESILTEVDQKFATLAELRQAKTFFRKIKRWGLYTEVSSLLKRKQHKIKHII